MANLLHPFKVDYPNIRELFIPDLGYTLCATDLDRADLQVVAWDSGCETLKNLLKEGLDVHLFNAGQAFHLDITLDQLRDPNRVSVLESLYKRERTLAKGGGHATNYIVHASTLATALNINQSEAQSFIDNYFLRYPEIKDWHKRIWHELVTTQTISNAFGFRSVYFNRITDATLREAVAWIPQSTVGLVINEAWERLEQTVPSAEVLLQVHDELIYQIPTAELETLLPDIRRAFSVTIPYPDPLVIPAGLKTSTISWAKTKKTDWGDHGEELS
jgi:DNA polymerase-1